jgi:hypothetical protein
MLHNPIEFLKQLKRFDLAALLQLSRFEFSEPTVSDFYTEFTAPLVTVISPPAFTEAMAGLADWDKKRIGEAIAAAFTDEKVDPEHLSFAPDASIDLSQEHLLLAEIVIHRNQMISVATGKDRIQEVNDYYRARHTRISTALATLGVTHSNPHENLWDWFNKWKEEFPTYKLRREYVNDLYSPIVERFTGDDSNELIVREPTGWERVDRALEKAHAQIKVAEYEKDFQAIGLLCREILISLGQAVFDSSVHTTNDGILPSSTDAGRMIEAFILKEAFGPSNENLRRHAKASLNLAVELQHKRSADLRVAALSLEATFSVVNIVAILSGRRDR